MVIKNILKEELNNSLKMKNRYESQLKKLPKGSLCKKKIKDHEYYYLVYRKNNGKVALDYKGKADESFEAEYRKWQAIKEKRDKYRESISQLKKQIKFINRALSAG